MQAYENTAIYMYMLKKKININKNTHTYTVKKQINNQITDPHTHLKNILFHKQQHTLKLNGTKRGQNKELTRVI